jgi:4-O-beta-D-mannosyl-D-glucose phosphorylase
VVTHRPGSYFLAPEGEERVGDVSNVVFSNGWVAREDGQVFIYCGSSDTRLQVATSTVEKLLDYVLHTPQDPMHSYACVEQRYALIEKNLNIMRAPPKPAASKPVRNTRRAPRKLA